VSDTQPVGHLRAACAADTSRVTTALTAPPRIVAHRGFSSRQPESTLAAYQEAIDWSLAEGVPVGLECDVHLTADDELVCLHDARLGRTVDAVGPVSGWTLADLRRLDFGSWRVADPTPEQASLVSLVELLTLVRDARTRGADVELVIETKHPQARGLELERRVCRLLAAFGWDVPGAPARLITFSVPAAELLGRLVPHLHRTLLISGTLTPFASGGLPQGVDVAGVDVRLLRRDPGFVARAAGRGHEVHVWTANDPDDIRFCRDLGVTGFTSDHPDRVLEVLGRGLCGARPLVSPQGVRVLAGRAACGASRCEDRQENTYRGDDD
jgi:glycerophosphoryl diester phosphodiesterase